MKNARDIIIAPIVTEKTAGLQQNHNTYTFKVASDANKIEIKKAIEEIFKVKVLSVNTLYTHSKNKRVGRYTGETSRVKKAVVKLAEGNSIELK
jgi:large subunit ribosomal protein L23